MSMSIENYSHRITEGDLNIIREFTAQVPVRVGALAKALGLRVLLSTLPLNISGMLEPDDEGGHVIKINRFEPKERQRFTIAHEIAHYLLHRHLIARGVVDSALYRSKLSSRLEAEANRLAADILMPRILVEQERDSVPDGVDVDRYLAQKFEVSLPAMEIRTG